MTRSSLCRALLLATALLLPACRQFLPTNRYLQPAVVPEASMSTADARRAFDHAKHQAPFGKFGVSCPDCHQFGVLIDASNADLAKALATHALHPPSAACHTCHRRSATHVEGAPSACFTCHRNTHPLMPASHDAGWQKAHATLANADPASCDDCHRQSFCIDCHTRRDTIQTIVHERNFRFYHSVQARANPIQCGSCHREDFCANCHQQAIKQH